MQKVFIGLLACASCLLAASPKDREEADKRLNSAADTLAAITSAPDKGIPHELLESAKCAVIVPGVKKGAFIVGAQFGKGFMTCRRTDHRWSAPAAIRLEGGSFGFQIGGSETDVVMLVMNDHGAQRLMGDKFTLGAEGEIAAGPVGRDASAQTDAKLTAEILSWSRTRGAFAGIALKGATLRPDHDDNEALYGKRLETREVINGSVTPPPAAQRLLGVLGETPREKR